MLYFEIINVSFRKHSKNVIDHRNYQVSESIKETKYANNKDLMPNTTVVYPVNVKSQYINGSIVSEIWYRDKIIATDMCAFWDLRWANIWAVSWFSSIIVVRE